MSDTVHHTALFTKTNLTKSIYQGEYRGNQRRSHRNLLNPEEAPSRNEEKSRAQDDKGEGGEEQQQGVKEDEEEGGGGGGGEGGPSSQILWTLPA